MNKEGFREWLRASHSEKATTNRVSRVGRVERALNVLSLPYRDLDEAYESDRLDSVIKALRTWVAKSKLGERPPAPLVRDTTKPDKQVLSLMNAIQNYVRFRDGKNASDGSWPALEQIRNDFLERVPEFERFTKTDNEYESTERVYKDGIRARIEAIVAESDEKAGHKIFEALLPQKGPFLQWNTEASIRKANPDAGQEFFNVIAELARGRGDIISTIMGGIERLNGLRAVAGNALTVGEIASVAITVPAFVRPKESAPFKVRKARKVALILTGDQIFKGDNVEREQVESWLALLRRIFDVMDREWGWEPRDLFDVQGFLWAALDERWVEDEGADGDEWITLFDAEGVAYRPQQQRNQQTDQVAYRIKPAGASNETAAAIATNDVVEVARALLIEGRPVRIAAEGASVANYLRFPGKLVGYRLRPDIAEGLGIALESATLETMQDRSMKVIPPTNLIFYGPPGTGKTYATAEEALKLCGEEIPETREDLMAAYRRLAEAGRIEFVTFHQSYAYEEFVEGLRPVQQEEHSAGFHLEAEAGVLRRVARRAETSTGSGGPAFTIGDRQVFKMSIGEAANPDDAHLFEEAIAGGYALLGFEDIDWSDDQFANRDAIINAVKAHGVIGSGEPNAASGRVQMPFIFRNSVKPGDIIVVSKGNSRFRAIGEVTGEYQFVPREGGDYGHRRAVRWLWVDRTGLPLSEIYSRNFTMKSIYSLTRADLNVPALERYIASQQAAGTGAPQSFVLIIDEINRANVSKVMGELITLLEPDKRIGATNELRIRLPYSRDLFGLPPNLHIIGTMNTADRSIALLDTALRRRFKFREVAPEPQLLDEAQKATGIPLVAFLSTINDRIEYLLDREHRIGHAYFMKCRKRGEIDAIMRDAVIPLLQEYFFEDLSRVAVVLGEPRGGGFLGCRQIKDPLGEGDARDSWIVLPEFVEDAYHRSVKSETSVHLVNAATQEAE